MVAVKRLKDILCGKGVNLWLRRDAAVHGPGSDPIRTERIRTTCM